jgi:hypothetical protein
VHCQGSADWKIFDRCRISQAWTATS